MEIVSLLGAILDRMAFEQNVDWDYDCDTINVTIKATSEMKDYAESLIDECTDCININRNEYDYITKERIQECIKQQGKVRKFSEYE